MKSISLLRSSGLWFCAATVMALAGCGQKPAATTAAPAADAKPAAAPSGKKITLAFIPKGMAHVYWKSVEAGMRAAEKEAKDKGQNLEVIWNGPANENDRQQEIGLVETFTGQKLDGIILCPLDADALVAPAEKAHRAGIPLVIVDSPLNYKDIVALVATDNYKAGQIAGEELAKELGGKGGVILLRFMQGSASTEGREKGFLDTMAKYPNIKVLSSNNYGGDSSAGSLNVGSNLLNTFKGQVDGVFTPNEPSTNGMLLALQQAGLAGKVKFVGFDGGQTNMDGLNAGQINALVLQDPYTMGYKGVNSMLDFLAGKKVEPMVDTGAVLLTKDNLNTPAVKALLDHTVTK